MDGCLCPNSLTPILVTLIEAHSTDLLKHSLVKIVSNIKSRELISLRKGIGIQGRWRSKMPKCCFGWSNFENIPIELLSFYQSLSLALEILHRFHSSVSISLRLFGKPALLLKFEVFLAKTLQFLSYHQFYLSVLVLACSEVYLWLGKSRWMSSKTWLRFY